MIDQAPTTTAAPPLAAATTATTALRIRIWQWTNTALAIIGLASLADDSIKWVRAIHWVVEQYRVVRSWLFGWLPFRIPEDWHDFTVLALVLMSVTAAGYYSTTREWFPLAVLRSVTAMLLDMLLMIPAGIVRALALVVPLKKIRLLRQRIDDIDVALTKWGRRADPPEIGGWGRGAVVLLALVTFLHALVSKIELPTQISAGVVLLIWWYAAGGMWAWRWLLVTVAIFAGLVGVNELYVRAFQPMGY